MIDLSLWSSVLNNDLLLKQITMPGSHDATIYDGADFTKTGITKYMVSRNKSITQSGSIAHQCQLGSRFFDVRLKLADGVVRGYHQTAGQGGVGASADKILDDVDDFLRGRASEFVILRISHTSRDTDIVNHVLNHRIANRLYKGTGNVANARIGDLRGKAICIFDAKKFGFKKNRLMKDKASQLSQANGIHAFHKYSAGATYDDGLGVCGCFKGSSSINEVLGNAVQGAEEHACHADDHLFFMYWQQTYGNVEANTKQASIGIKTVKGQPKLTGGTHANTPGMIKLMQQKSALNAAYRPKDMDPALWQSVVTTRGDRMCLPNVISYDFINAKTSEEIVLINDPGTRQYIRRRA